jgi:hypothetical protein
MEGVDMVVGMAEEEDTLDSPADTPADSPVYIAEVSAAVVALGVELAAVV